VAAVWPVSGPRQVAAQPLPPRNAPGRPNRLILTSSARSLASPEATFALPPANSVEATEKKFRKRAIKGVAKK